MPVTWLAALLCTLPGEPRHWEDEIVYGIIIEKFSDGDPTNNFMKNRFLKDKSKYEGGFWGGDLKGILEKLDAIVELGVTTILIYPVMQNDENAAKTFLPTGYRPKDYEQVDRNFGDITTLKSVVDAAHQRGLRVILDMPLTLPGFEHPYLSDPSKKGWFGPVSEYGVPRWKVENPEVADYIIGVGKRWKERSGCDGFRLDSAHLQPVDFWKRFVSELKAAPPEGPFLLIPELTINPREIGKFVTQAGFDGAYDFSVLQVRDVFGKGDDVGKLSFVNKEAKQLYPSTRHMLAPIDNYEKAFATLAKAPKAERTKLALTYILTLDRVPLLYAGNELGIAFDEVGGAFPQGRDESPFLKDVKALIALRKNEPTLRRGDFTEVYSRDSVYAFLRTLGENRILVVFNGSKEYRNFTTTIGGKDWKEICLEDLMTGENAKTSGNAKAIRIEAFGSRMLRVK